MSALPAAEIRHPVFSRVWTSLSRFAEAEFGRHRAALLAGLHGEVVEVGAGNGLNFAHYPTEVSRVLAVEPEAYLRDVAADAAAKAPVPVEVIAGRAESLPLPDASVDAAVACLVLCSVEDQPAALAELHRVLRPGGTLAFLEHVAAPVRRRARIQRGLDASGVWPLLAGGCHCHRATPAAIRAAGFQIESERAFDLAPSWIPINPLVLGRARRPA